MTRRRAAALGVLVGAALVAVPVALYVRTWLADWDRAWGYR